MTREEDEKMDWIQQTKDGVLIRVKLVPRASVNRMDGLHGDALKIRLNAPPVDGKANAALLRFLADILGISASCLALASGETSRNKTIRVLNLDEMGVRSRLLQP